MYNNIVEIALKMPLPFGVIIPGPVYIAALILLVCVFEIIVTILLIRKKEFRKDTAVEIISNPIPDKNSSMDKVISLNEELATYGFAYLPEKDIFYSIMNGWQRNFGYCQLYDEMAVTISLVIDCEPIRFEYGGKKWMIEFWKGQYGMTTGSEIGVYTTTGPDLNIPGFFNGTFYQSAKDEDFLQMSMTLRKNDEVLYTVSGLHWWLTAFKLAEFSHPSELVVDIEVTLKDSEMRDAFVNELIAVGYAPEELSIIENTVSLTFDKPHSTQPFTRIPLTEYLMQKNNEQNCNAYKVITKDYANTITKLEYLKEEEPKLYRHILNLGKSKQFFGDYDTIKNFIQKNDILNR